MTPFQASGGAASERVKRLHIVPKEKAPRRTGGSLLFGH
jgi:hypothetical protein